MSPKPRDRFSIEEIDSIDELDAIITTAQARRGVLCDALLADCTARVAAAHEENRALLARHNIPYQPSQLPGAAKKPRRRVSAAVYKKGRQYRHPDESKLVFTAGGSYPKWVQQLHADGKRAIEVPIIVSPEAAKDAAVVQMVG